MSKQWSGLHALLHQTLRQKMLLRQGDRILVAVSGGQDSLCLVKLLIDLQKLWKWELAIAHCDHRWATDQGMAEHVEKIARQWQVKFYLKIANSVIKETEAAAREWRYQALTEIAEVENFSCVVTGHTQSDRAETLLYNLIRGASADGLSALKWVRPLTETIQLVRPLLNVSRHQTKEFCQQFKLPIWDDPVNYNLKYTRNRIRNSILPQMREINQQVEAALAQTAEILTAEAELLESEARKILQQAIAPDRLGLDRNFLRPIPLALQRRIIRLFLAKISDKSPNFEQIEEVTSLINAANRSRTSSLPRGISAVVDGNYIVFEFKFERNNQSHL